MPGENSSTVLPPLCLPETVPQTMSSSAATSSQSSRKDAGRLPFTATTCPWLISMMKEGGKNHLSTAVNRRRNIGCHFQMTDSNMCTHNTIRSRGSCAKQPLAAARLDLVSTLNPPFQPPPACFAQRAFAWRTHN